jgi:phenylalanyl-tRNA synthetase beta chain
MNILIPHQWLLEHLDTKATPTEIQKYLSLCGPSVERIYDREDDQVYDIEVTTNRVDSMSVRGIAREAAVILTQFGIPAKLKPHNVSPITFEKKKLAALPLPTIVNDDKLCRRIVCVVLSHVDRAATPEWMATRLRQVELNVHDAVIDITNYITHELGHPCHAFDYDKIMELGGTIIIKTATAGQSFTTLDGNQFTTLGGEVIFENDRGEVIDLPGIKGTLNTAIADDTKNVLFFIENTLPEKIRFGSMSHAIRTVAAQLNEKNVDPHLALPVLEGGTELFKTLTHARIASPLFDTFPGKRQLPKVKVSTKHITDYLGIELPINTVATILEQLGCQVSLSKGVFTVQPPTFRPDITIPADVIEEIARIYGYHNLPSVLMPTSIPLNKPAGTDFTVENRIKRFFAAIGWQEVYTYSMVSKEVAEQSGYGLKDHLMIQNPLTDDRVYMRRSLLPSLAELVEQNTQYPELSVFEIANVYHPKKSELPDEELSLSMVSRRPLTAVKGDLETLLSTSYLKEIRYQQMGNHQAEIIVTSQAGKTTMIGTVTLLSRALVAVEIPVATFIAAAHSHPRYEPLPKTNAVYEDMTFTLPVHTEVGEVIRTIHKLSPLIRRVEFISQYQENLSFHISYQDLEQQISEETIFALRKEITEAIQKLHKGILVGGLQ